MTPDGLIATASVRLAAAGVETPRAEARRLLAHLLGVERGGTLSLPPLTPQQVAAFEGLVARRAAREPFAYIAGRKEFWSLEFEVGPGVLVPRPDTETLIEEALRRVPDRDAPLRIADLGTGSGAILVAALTEFPNATGIGFESAPPAHAYAVRNAARHVGGRAEISASDWNRAAGPFDLVFSNPPYIATADIESLEPEVARREPRAALDGGRDGLDAYRALAELLPRILGPGGFALLEMGQGQVPALKSLFGARAPGLEIVAVAPDLGGVSRCLTLRKP
ncbi:MAG TPA: peptide chain release factor N(5)-glutamine methyltransferase [Rhizomicrobium sp.]|nr:peptide chain release factor N(5)-glutamine methyltransferase [Rhizomicrobium sp.]